MNLNVMTVAIAAVCAASVAQAETAPQVVAYVDGAVAGSLTGVAGDPEAGKAVVSDRGLGNCVACHQISALPDVPFQGNVGPALDGAADRWDEPALRGIVSNAKMTFEGTVMPAFYKNTGYIRPGDLYTGEAATSDPLPSILTAQEVEDVVAFLQTLKEQ